MVLKASVIRGYSVRYEEGLCCIYTSSLKDSCVKGCVRVNNISWILNHHLKILVELFPGHFPLCISSAISITFFIDMKLTCNPITRGNNPTVLTGLSCALTVLELSFQQVSNWFTNARVRLWKPMVEEMHALEKKTQCSKAAEDSQNFFDLSSNQQMSLHAQLPEKDFQISYSHRENQDNTTSQCKRSRIEAFPSRIDHGKQEFSLLCNRLPSYQVLDVGASQTDARLSHSSIANNQNNTPGLSWSSHGQIVPFWLAKQ
jgi:hypothetical protein